MSKRKPDKSHHLPSDEDDVVEIEEYDELEQVSEEEVRRVDLMRSRAERQLRRGRLSRLNDRIAGGPARPGEQVISRSPFVQGMCFLILLLGIVAAVFLLLDLSIGEQNRLRKAREALDAARYNDAAELYEDFLVDYPDSKSAETVRIEMHTAHVRKFTDDERFSVQSAVEAQQRLDDFFKDCRDLDGFREEHQNLVRYAERIARIAAQVAFEKTSQEALDASVRALALLERLTEKDTTGDAAEKREELLLRQRQASAQILKSGQLSSAIKSIDRLVKDGDTIAALAIYKPLVNRYAELEDDGDFQQAVSSICEKEVELVDAEDLGIDPILIDPEVERWPSLSVNLTTQAPDLMSDGRRVFGVSGDTVYALDSETGDPIWRRYVGGQAPFAPIQVDVSSPALLLFHSERNELMLVQQSDGSLVWRQSIESAASGPPLILSQQIYVTTEAGDLWQVSLSTGRAVRRIRFSQSVQGPPAVSRDRQSLIIPGRSEFVYTLSLQSLECRAASWLGFGDGSVGAPILTIGDLILMCENHSAEESRLWALQISDDGQLIAREQHTVVGQIWDPCVLRGNELYVPSSPQRLTAFRVSNQPDEEVFSEIGTSQLENAEFASMFLAAGPGGNVWMASSALRRFLVTTQGVSLDEALVAEGQHLYPAQTDNDSLLVTTREPYSSSVFLTRVNRKSMTDIWRTVLRTNIVSAGPSTSGNALIAISDFGEVFRLPVDEVSESDFHTKSVSRFRMPDGLRDPVGGLKLPDGRLAVWCRGTDRALWTFSPNGLLDQKWPPLPGIPEANPVPLAGGLVVASRGRLTLTATRDQADDYLVSQDPEAEASWRSLTAISDTQLIAINSDNQLVRIEYRRSPRPHLAEVSVTAFDGAANVAPAAGGDYLCISTADGRLVLMRSSTLERVTERDSGTVVSYPPQISGDRLFVEFSDDQVDVYELNDDLRTVGTIPKNGSQLLEAPLPLPNGGFLAAFSDGAVIRLDLNGLPDGDPVHLGRQLQRGPMVVGRSVVVLATDGSMFFLNDLVNR